MPDYISKPSTVQEKLRIVLECFSPPIYNRIIAFLAKQEDNNFKDIIKSNIEKITKSKEFPIFSSIEIETINRCNNTCKFCPVNREIDPRSFTLMEEKLFLSIMEQLKDLKYSGSVALFSNNEPLLDKRIYDFHKIARTFLPDANLYMFTNGILLNIDRFLRLMEFLDVLVIDNYSDNLSLIKPIEEIYQFIKTRSEYEGKVKINIIRSSSIRKTRGGEAKNREKLNVNLKSSCLLPFSQLIVRPDGKISLCCQDALGKYTLGDLTKEKVLEVWNGYRYQEIRHKIQKGRSTMELCSKCDIFPFEPAGISRKI